MMRTGKMRLARKMVQRSYMRVKTRWSRKARRREKKDNHMQIGAATADSVPLSLKAPLRLILEQHLQVTAVQVPLPSWIKSSSST